MADFRVERDHTAAPRSRGGGARASARGWKSKGEVIEVLPEHDAKRRQLADELYGQGFGVIALANKQMPGAPDDPVYPVKDESELMQIRTDVEPGFIDFARE